MIHGDEMLRNIWDENADSLGQTFLASLLYVPSALYGVAAGLRNCSYDRGIFRSRKLSRPVISIGNITAGGTGKTPMAIMLAGMLKEAGRKPAILSRGYGRESSERIVIVADGCRTLGGPRQAGDEPFLMAGRLPGVPVIAGSSRFLAGQAAIEKLAADVLVLDDGFQHRCLHRDLDIVLLDEARPFGNGRLLPGGSLREPPGALHRAGIIIMTGSERRTGNRLLPGGQGFLPERTPVFQGVHKPVALIGGDMVSRPPCHLQGKRIHAFAGIGNPHSFRRTIEGLGARLVGFAAFCDHHVYRDPDIARISGDARLSGADLILTTEKDGVRLQDFPEFRSQIYQLRIEMEIISRRVEFLSLILDNLAKNER